MTIFFDRRRVEARRLREALAKIRAELTPRAFAELVVLHRASVRPLRVTPKLPRPLKPSHARLVFDSYAADLSRRPVLHADENARRRRQ